MFRLTHILSISAAFLFLFPAYALAAQNAGLVDGIWFSQPEIVEGVPVTISVVVHNETDDVLNGSVVFAANGEDIGTAAVSIQAHDIARAQIVHTFDKGEAAISTSFESSDARELEFTRLPARTIVVDTDTDGDGVGNRKDTDDDNDGILDADDAEPLIKNEPTRSDPVTIASTTNAIIDRLLGTSTDEQSTSTAARVARGAAEGAVATLTSLESIRVRTAENIQGYQEEQRQKLDAIERASVEGFQASESEELPDAEEKTQAQIAAVGAAVLGSIFEHEMLFYAHIVLLLFSLWHVIWGYFKRKYRAQY